MQALWLENLTLYDTKLVHLAWPTSVRQTLSFRQNLPLPVPPAGEALVRLSLAGICSTDLEMVQGYYPFRGIPGHEFVGVVASVLGNLAEEKAWEGKRVVGEINVSCGACPTCQAGRSTHCEHRSVLGLRERDGVFAEYFLVPLRNLHLVPEALEDEKAVFTELLAAALQIQEQVSIQSSQRSLLIGAGRLGQLIAQTLALTGCNLQVAARYPQQRALLARRGIPSIQPEQIPLASMDVVVEATGSAQGFDLARRAVRPRGVIVLKSTYRGDVPVNLSHIVVNEVTIVGSRCGPFPKALQLLASGQVDPLPLIDSQYPLSAGLSAFERAAQPGVLKVLIAPR